MSAVNQQRQNCEPVGEVYSIQCGNSEDAYAVIRIPSSSKVTSVWDLPIREGSKLYAAPPKREPLSEDEIKQIEFTVRTYKREPLDVVAFASAIERAHGIGVQS